MAGADFTSTLSSKPKHKVLNKYRDLHKEWYVLGVELEINNEDLKDIEDKYSDDRMRMLKIFGIWLEKGENPTYRTILKALVDIDKKDIAQSISTELGLTSTLDSLLNTTPAKLSECSAKEIDASTDTLAPVSDQLPQSTTVSESVLMKSPATSCTGDQPIPLADSSHQEQVKDHSTNTSDTSDHSEAKSKRSLTDPASSQKSVAYGTNVHGKSSSDTDDQTLILCDSSHHGHSTKDQTGVISDQTALIDTSTSSSSTNDPHQIMLHCNHKLITSLSADPQGIAGFLLAKGLIPENTEAQMRQCSTPHEKATILVTTVRQRIEIAPKRFQEFLEILAQQAWTKDIMEVLKSYSIGSKQLRKDAGVQAVNTCDHGSTDTKCESSGEISSNGEDYTFPKLNSQDKAELEAQLILNADSMRKKFASLLVNVVSSLKHQGIDPRQLATAILALTEYDDPGIGKPLLERDKEDLMKAQTVDHTFDVLRPHMTFFNYEILEFLIEQMGSPNDKDNLQQFLQEFRRFCRRSVFEIPRNMFGHSAEKVKDQQKFCVKITKQFKAALLVQCKKQSEPDSQTASSIQSQEEKEGLCAPELGISLEDAKHIQRKLASVLKLKVSSIYLDSVSPGSTILIFLFPSHISLAGLDSDPEVITLSSSGIHILCGPPGKPKLEEITPTGMIMEWSPPEYGCDSLTKYQLHYQKKSELETSQWQKLELTSLECRTCLPDLSDGYMYMFKVCAISDVGTLQYSNESDLVIISAEGTLINNIHKVIVAKNGGLTSPFPSADANTFAALLSTKGVISQEDETQINLASTPSEKAALLITAIERPVNNDPEKFQTFLNSLSEAKLSQCGDIAETLWLDYYDSVYREYLDYLKFLYASLDNKQTSFDQWLPSVTKKFFRLAMIKTATVQRGDIEDNFVQMTITGKLDDILGQKCPIQLEDIFKETKGKRKVILLEGAPGCGKSTLSVYICQQWEKGQLFIQFKLVILIQLRDPAIRQTKGLADLLPCPDSTTAQQIAARMLASNCQDVLFILDGWDELPPNLQINSIFHQLVQPELPQSNPLCESTVIVTSRPIASGDLHQVVPSRIEILGFTVKELHQFFTECLKGDTEAVKTLLERIEENPEVACSCYLPLNATILVHLFKSDRNTLPTTLYGIFSSLILNCIKHHLKLHTQYKDVPIESLDQLPELAKRPFLVLCQLAYDGVMEDKIIFTSLPPDVTTLSLLQGVESFIGRQKAVSYNFIHLSIQELLAAWYIATLLTASEQVSKFNELFDKFCFIAVFKFYSAITKLKTPGIKDVVLNVAKKYSRELGHSITKGLMVSLLHCLCEAQDPSLCESVARQLQYGLDLRGTTLTPSDCLCIGCFLAHVCKMAAGEFIVNLDSCSIGDLGCKCLVSGLHKYLDTDSAVTTLLHMGMDSNTISHHGFSHLSTLFEIGCCNYLDLTYNNHMLKQDTVHAPFYKQLQSNTTLQELFLQGCGLNSQSAESLAKALTTNKHLKVLSLSDNALCDDGVQHLAHALRVNQGLKDLYLNSCGITDVGLEFLVKSLQCNNVLNKLSVYNSGGSSNRLTETIVPVLTECLQNNHTLTGLSLPENLESSTASIEKAVNDVRKRNGLRFIRVTVDRQQLMSGFECEFVEKPPKAFQFECPICLLVIREPYQATCCGKSFCKECIHRIKVANQACPTCNKRDFTLFPNKGLQQSLHDFQVYCTHKSKGCEWTGELRELDNHLNSDPPADKSLQGCPYTLIKCPLSFAGCEKGVCRKDIKSHVNDNLLGHVMMQNAQMRSFEQQLQECHSQLQEYRSIITELKAQLEEGKRDKKHLEERIARLEAKSGNLDTAMVVSKPQAPGCLGTRITSTVKPVGAEFIMANFNEYKRDNDSWYSPHFYTHPNGYKMCLRVFANGVGSSRGTHLTVYVCLMRGEFDDQLKWPFRGNITIRLVNQEDKGNILKTIKFTERVSQRHCQRVKTDEPSSGCGCSFLPLTELQPEYLKNDCIKLCIKKVEVF